MKHRFSAPNRLTFWLLFSSFLLTAGASSEELASQKNTPPKAKSGQVDAPEHARCILRKDESGWWFVSPSGKSFFSLGICVFNQGTTKEGYDPAKPSYAGFRHYDSTEAWRAASVGRLKSWGFTTLGGWSDYKTLGDTTENDLWMTPVINLGARSGAPWFDMWDPKVTRRIDELAEETIIPLAPRSACDWLLQRQRDWLVERDSLENGT